MPIASSRPSLPLPVAVSLPLLLGLALLFAPRHDEPAGFAPDHEREAPILPAPAPAPPRPQLAIVPHAAECDGGDGSGRTTPPTPADSPGSWVLSEDYPASAIRASRQGRSRFRLAVDETGRAAGCTITASSGTGALDAAACTALTARARFNPARDAMGCPIPASYSSSVLWRIPPG